MESGPARRLGYTATQFDPDDPAPGYAGPDVEEEPEGRVWGAGGRPQLLAVRASPPASRRRRPADLGAVGEHIRGVALARERRLPVPPALDALLPDGLRRGTTVGVTGSGATSFALALVSAASAAGSWVVAVGVDDLGLAAAGELGVGLERLAAVAAPPPGTWASVVAALVGSVDVVLVSPATGVRAGDLRRLEARSRERGSVLVQLGDPARWPAAHDLVVALETVGWRGLGDGHGRLTSRRVRVAVTGRRDAARPRRAELLLPDLHGRLAALDGVEAAGAWAGSDIGAGEADEAMTAGTPLREVG